MQSRFTLGISLSLLGLSFTLSTQAQDFELFKMESSYYPQRSVLESSVDGEIGFWEWGGELSIPLAFKNKKTVLIHKFGYSSLNIEVSGRYGTIDLEESKDYHSILYELSWVQTLNKQWQLLVSVNPTLASDLDGHLDSEDLLFQARTLAMKTQSKKMKYGYGLAYNTRFGRQIIVPLVMFKYKTPKIEIDAVLPGELSAMWNVKKRFQYGLEAFLDGGLYNNTSDVQVVNSEINELGYSRLNMGPAISYKVKDAIKIYVTGGAAVGRRLDFIDAAEETFNRTPDNGPFIKLGLSVQPKIKPPVTTSSI